MRVNFRNRRSNASKPASIGGKIAGTLFLSLFFFMGLFFAVMLVREFMDDMATRKWKITPCEIISSKVNVDEGSDDPFTGHVHYAYSYRGHKYTSSSVYRKDNKAYTYYDKALRDLEKFPAGTRRNCYVNPKAPTQSILVHGSPWIILFIILPLIFMAIGAGIPIAMWMDRGKQKEKGFESLSEKAPKRRFGKQSKRLFFAIFAAIGAGVFFPFFGSAMFKAVQAGSWEEVPCKILFSRMRSHDSDDGTTYRADIFFQYEYQGQVYKSNRVRFIGGSSSGTEGKRKLLKQYPRGSKRTCFVNPANPVQAVLLRGFHPIYLVSLLPLLFLFIGIGGLLGFIGGDRQQPDYYGSSASGSPSGAQGYDPAAWQREGAVTLKPSQGPWAKLLWMTFFALIWNGIVSVMVYQVVQGWMNGRGQWFLTLFSIPFVLVGLGLIVGIFYSIFALFTPRVSLTVSHPAIPLGERLALSWNLTGSPASIRRFQVYMAGITEVQYTRGTDTRTDTEEFIRMDLVDITDTWDMANGELDIVLPDETMPSFEGEHNKVKWSICIRGDIPRRPDIKEEFVIQVLPKPMVTS